MSQDRRCGDRRRRTGRDHPGGRAGQPRDRGRWSWSGRRPGGGGPAACSRRPPPCGRWSGPGLEHEVLGRYRATDPGDAPRDPGRCRGAADVRRGRRGALGGRVRPVAARPGARGARAEIAAWRSAGGRRVSAVKLDPDGVATLRRPRGLDSVPGSSSARTARARSSLARPAWLGRRGCHPGSG